MHYKQILGTPVFNPVYKLVTLATANESNLRAAIAAATTPTTITWSGVITLTADLELQNKSYLQLNCFCQGGLSRSNSSSMIIIRGGLVNCAIRGIDFVNTNTTVSNGSLIRFNEQGIVDGLHIESNSFLNTGTDNNAISSNSSGGANDQFITSHKNVHIKRNKFGGNVGTGSGISRMAIEVVNHSADGAGPVQVCEGFYIEHNEIYKCGTGSADGFGISVSGLFRTGRIADNTIIDAKKYSLEGVALCDFVIERNVVTDIDNSSNGLSLSNGYKAAGQWPDGTMERVIVRDNTFNVKGRAILSYYYNNCQFTRNYGRCGQRCEWIGDDNTITKNKFDVWNDWNAMYFASSSRNRIVDNKAQTYYHGNGIYTSSVIFFDSNANSNYVRTNTLTRPSGSYNVHIEQASGLSNDIGAAFQSATNTLNAYVTSDALIGQPTAGLPSGGVAGQFLQKKSGADYDMRWTSFPHQLKNAYPIGNWIQPIEGAYVETGTTIGNPNGFYFIPFYVQRGITISDLGARVTTAVASSSFQLCIYASRPTDFLPGVKLASTGDMSGATVATISAVLTESTVSLDPFTVYWFGVNCNVAGIAFMASSVLTGVYTSLIGSSSITNMLNAVPNSSMVVTSNATYGTYPDLTSATVSANGANAKRHAIPLMKVSGYVS